MSTVLDKKYEICKRKNCIVIRIHSLTIGNLLPTNNSFHKVSTSTDQGQKKHFSS